MEYWVYSGTFRQLETICCRPNTSQHLKRPIKAFGQFASHCLHPFNRLLPERSEFHKHPITDLIFDFPAFVVRVMLHCCLGFEELFSNGSKHFIPGLQHIIHDIDIGGP